MGLKIGRIRVETVTINLFANNTYFMMQQQQNTLDIYSKLFANGH